MYLPVCEKCFWKDIKNLGRGLEWLGKGQGHFVGVEVGGKLEGDFGLELGMVTLSSGRTMTISEPTKSRKCRCPSGDQEGRHCRKLARQEVGLWEGALGGNGFHVTSPGHQVAVKPDPESRSRSEAGPVSSPAPQLEHHRFLRPLPDLRSQPRGIPRGAPPPSSWGLCLLAGSLLKPPSTSSPLLGYLIQF